MKVREKFDILSGGLILITLGCLLLFDNMEVYGFSKSWPILLMVIAFSILIQRFKDIGGWMILIISIIYLLLKNWKQDLHILGTYILPVILIVVGINLFWKKRRKG
jgi:predicted membrane protein